MKPSSVTAEEFIEWRKSLGMSQSAAANRLGISVSSIFNYELGHRDERKVYIPVLVALGMSAVKAGLQPYKKETNEGDAP